MARIRSIKPEFWDSPDTARADLRTRLLYIAMWNWADDYGIGDASPVRLIGFAFPSDDIPAADYPRLLADVSDAFGVVYFEHEGRRFFTIPAWEQHQRTEKKAKAKPGLLDAAKSAIERAKPAGSGNESDGPTVGGGSSDECVGSSFLGTGEVGTGEREEKTSPSAAPLELIDIPTAEPRRSEPSSRVESLPRKFEEFWAAYPQRTGKGAAIKAYTKVIKNTDPAEIIAGARRYSADPNRDPSYTAHPATWLNAQRWTDDPLPLRGGKKPNSEAVGRNLRAATAQLAQEAEENS